MTSPTIEQIANMAELACFYVTPGGFWLRMDYCEIDEGYFQCHDEGSGEEYRVEFSEVTLEEKECFQELEKMELPTEDDAVICQFPIPKKDQDDVMAAYWSMMRELETKADNGGHALEKHFVEGYYRLWNRITGDNKSPNWH